MLANAEIFAPIWIRSTVRNTIAPLPKFGGDGDARVEAALLAGPLLCDGIGNVISVELSASAQRNVELAYDILQASRARQTKTEYIACPSCGRTQYDIQTINLYVRKECVERGIPQEEAVDRLIALIKSRGKWIEPEV